MKLRIDRFEPIHIEAAARLVSARYRELLAKVPFLPAKYAEEATLGGLLADLLRSGSGAVAICDGTISGFLAAWDRLSIAGRQSAFCPEWASGASGENGRRVIEALYTELAPHWRANGCHSHWISLLADDLTAREHWHWLGFGMVAADAVRRLEPLPRSSTRASVRAAGPKDLDAVMQLNESLLRHLAGSPVYLSVDSLPTADDYQALWAEGHGSVWLAEEGHRAMAFLAIGPAVQDACTIIRDDGTASILSAYTAESQRGGGIATALLNRALEWARARGFSRCAVDFEPMNPWARRFWMRHFEPVAYTVVRHLDALEGDHHGD